MVAESVILAVIVLLCILLTIHCVRGRPIRRVLIRLGRIQTACRAIERRPDAPAALVRAAHGIRAPLERASAGYRPGDETLLYDALSYNDEAYVSAAQFYDALGEKDLATNLRELVRSLHLLGADQGLC